MTKSTLNTKVLKSAAVGFATAAVVVGLMSFGPSLTQTLTSEALGASQSARTQFAAATPKASITDLKPPAPTPPATAPAVSVNYQVAQISGDANETQSEND